MTEENFTPAAEQNDSLFKLMPATLCIIAINLLVFAAMVVKGVNIFEPTSMDIYNWGGNMRLYTLGGDWWRLITNVFVHIGIVHILCNMYGLFYIGSLLEPMLGRTRYVVAYLCTGILASLVSIWWSADRISAGASGAIFGMYGLFLALLTTKLIHPDIRKSLMQSSAVFIGYNLLYGLKGGVDNSAHIGGLVSGFVFGYVLYAGIIMPRKQMVTVIAMVAITLGLSGFYLFKGKNDIVVYEQHLQKFSELEQKAIEPRKNLKGKTTEEVLNIFEKICLPAWKEAKVEIEKTLTLKLPDNLQKDRAFYMDYTNLRLNESTLLIKSVKDTTGSFGNEVDRIQSSIDSIITLHNGNKNP